MLGVIKFLKSVKFFLDTLLKCVIIEHVLNSSAISPNNKIKKRDIKMAVKIRLTRMGSKRNLSTVLTLQTHVHHVMVVH